MTIKEAFEKLTSVCAAGMKNPFFVMRKLHDAFADIADKIEGGGGGSTVEVTQVVSTGTKIATITVNDTPTDLYAPTPTPASHNYSTTEQVVGKWIDGTTDVYEKTYVVDSIAFTENSCLVDANFPSTNIIISVDGFVMTSGEGTAGASLTGIPGIDNWSFGLHLARPTLVLYAGKSASVGTITGGKLFATVRYIKVSS